MSLTIVGKLPLFHYQSITQLLLLFFFIFRPCIYSDTKTSIAFYNTILYSYASHHRTTLQKQSPKNKKPTKSDKRLKTDTLIN